MTRVVCCLLFLSVSLETPARSEGESSRVRTDHQSRVEYLLPDTVLVETTKIRTHLRDLSIPATVISKEEIRSQNPAEVRQLIAGLPGIHSVDLSASENLGVVEARGFTAFGTTSYLQVLIDGLPVTDLETDRVDWTFLLPAQVERVEFLRGPLAFLHGNAAMAGAINLVPLRADRGMRAWIESRVESHETYSNAVGAEWAHRSTSLTLSANRRSGHGYRDHSGRSITGGLLSLRTRPFTAWSMRTDLLLHHGRVEIPGPLPAALAQAEPTVSTAPFNGDLRETETVQPSIEIRGDLSERTAISATVQADTRSVDATESIIPVGTLDRETRSRRLSGELRLELEDLVGGLNRVMLGAAGETGTLRSRYFDPEADQPWLRVGAGDVDRTNASLYLWIESRPHDLWMLQGGARFDRTASSMADPDDPSAQEVEEDHSAFSPSLGINVQLPDRGTLYMSAAGSFKSPTLEQLYDQRPYDLDGPGDMPAMHLSSPKLDPQRGLHFDLGTRLQPTRNSHLDAGIYYAKSTDEIGFDLATFSYNNIEESTHYGLESSLQLHAGDVLQTRLEYTFTRARFDGGENDGKQINSVPKQILHGQIRLAPPSGPTVTVMVSHVRDQWLDESNQNEIDPYTTTDLSVVQKVGAVTLFGSVHNLFNEKYASAGYVTVGPTGEDLPLLFPAAERSASIGLRLEQSSATK